MSNFNQEYVYCVAQLPALFTLDASCRIIALKVKLEAENTALHVIYIENKIQDNSCDFYALVTVTEWDGKTDKEEFFIEADSLLSLLEKLQRFDEINSFIFIKAPPAITIDSLTMPPQEMLCSLFPELGAFNKTATEEVLFGLKNSSLALLNRCKINSNLNREKEITEC